MSSRTVPAPLSSANFAAAVAGHSVGDRWQDVAGYLAPRTGDLVLPFLDLQYLLGLARAGRPDLDKCATRNINIP